jgi:predicted aldo/keto reductase-like oxidoreductase
VRLAEQVAGLRHRCKAVQLPVNLAMPEAYVLANQTVRGEPMSALQAAQRLGMLAFASGPLHQGRLARIRPAHVPLLTDLDPAGHALQFARSVPGVTSALVGMASPEHVVENTRLLGLPRAPQGWVDRAAQPPVAAVYS